MPDVEVTYDSALGGANLPALGRANKFASKRRVVGLLARRPGAAERRAERLCSQVLHSSTANGQQSSIRLLLQDIVEGTARTPRLPAELRNLAQQVKSRSQVSPDELVSELLLRLVDGTARNTAASAKRLLELDDKGIQGALRHRMRQIATESHPQWKQVKQLRAQVRHVLTTGNLDASECPGMLYDGEKLSARRVRQAVAQVLVDEDRPIGAKAIAAQVAQEYLPNSPSSEKTYGDIADREVESPEDAVRRALDAHFLARDLQIRLGRELFQVVALRASGAGFASIAKSLGVGLATAHSRWIEARARFREIVDRGGLSFATVGRVLGLMERHRPLDVSPARRDL